LNTLQIEIISKIIFIFFNQTKPINWWLFPRITQPAGEVEIPYHSSNPIPDFNITKEKCSARFIFPLNSTEIFTCAVKRNKKKL